MNNFILEQNIIDISLCDDLINFHKNSELKCKGMLGSDDTLKVNPEKKISTDVILPNCEVSSRYIRELRNCVDGYIEQYKFSSAYGTWGLEESMIIQHYKPGEGFFAWHTERSTHHIPNIYRHLAFMTYLNDVDNGGETEFFYHNIKVKPKKGKTLIWPADWTHTHRGITSLTEEKYIITGWFSYT